MDLIEFFIGKGHDQAFLAVRDGATVTVHLTHGQDETVRLLSRCEAANDAVTAALTAVAESGLPQAATAPTATVPPPSSLVLLGLTEHRAPAKPRGRPAGKAAKDGKGVLVRMSACKHPDYPGDLFALYLAPDGTAHLHVTRSKDGAYRLIRDRLGWHTQYASNVLRALVGRSSLRPIARPGEPADAHACGSAVAELCAASVRQDKMAAAM